MVGAKGRRRGTVLADLAAKGDRNRVVIPLLRRAAGEAENVIGLLDSSRSRVCAVGRFRQMDRLRRQLAQIQSLTIEIELPLPGNHGLRNHVKK
jgi:hypothetical protein